ncbi:MAG: SpoIID/LytB domain-containing protein [Armatimonadetes bacterium]|nr:SpoIID/LytB domain-containing protein [Armatimonadota bacterium]
MESSGRAWTARTLSIIASQGSLTIAGNGKQAMSVQIRPRGPVTLRTQTSPLAVLNCKLRFRPSSAGVQCVADVPLEEYTARVLAREMPLDWPPEALAAQAVVARSTGLASFHRHAADGYDVCSLTHCQLFSAIPVSPVAVAAVRRTTGWALARGARPVRAPFCSTCGGWTADGGAIGMEEWCRAVRDGPAGAAYCRESPHFSWKTVLTRRDVAAVFREASGEFVVLRRDSGGRVTRVGLKGHSQSIDGGEFLMRCGRTFGWARIKSCLLSIKSQRGSWLVSGHGLGHGVGMCQCGARGMAKEGKSWREILKHYYSAAELRRWP